MSEFQHEPTVPTNRAEAKARRQRLGSGIDLELELAKGDGIVGDAMRNRLLGRAQTLLERAWSTAGTKPRVRLAQRALELSPDAVDAYMILAMDGATTLREQADLLRRGADAGLRVLGSRDLSRYRGELWDKAETRPYMCVLFALAYAEWRLGNLGEAAVRCREVMQLDPDDRADIRYPFSHILLEAGLDDEARALLHGRDDLSIEWAYGSALLAFRTGSASESAHRDLQYAFMWNPYVVRFFNGKKPLPESPPPLYREGTVAEAASYVFDAHQSWLGTPGAIEWLLAEDALPKPWRSPRKIRPN